MGGMQGGGEQGHRGGRTYRGVDGQPHVRGSGPFPGAASRDEMVVRSTEPRHGSWIRYLTHSICVTSPPGIPRGPLRERYSVLSDWAHFHSKQAVTGPGIFSRAALDSTVGAGTMGGSML